MTKIPANHPLAKLTKAELTREALAQTKAEKAATAALTAVGKIKPVSLYGERAMAVAEQDLLAILKRLRAWDMKIEEALS